MTVPAEEIDALVLCQMISDLQLCTELNLISAQQAEILQQKAERKLSQLLLHI